MAEPGVSGTGPLMCHDTLIRVSAGAAISEVSTGAGGSIFLPSKMGTTDFSVPVTYNNYMLCTVILKIMGVIAHLN